MNDRRRINGPSSGTVPPVFASQVANVNSFQRPTRTRHPNQLRKIFLRTGLTPSASGSAYFELQNPESQAGSLIQHTSSLKIACSVHGPKPLPRSAPFSPQLVLTTNVKFAPYASRNLRRGYVRDAVERDIGVHLETALRGVIIGDRWPKSGVEVVVTVLEAEEDAWWVEEDHVRAGQARGITGAGSMTILAGCITAASAAILSAGIDCVDVIVGGVAALVTPPLHDHSDTRPQQATEVVLDPCPSEHGAINAACVVGYLTSRDEITEVWMKGDVGDKSDLLVDKAVDAAVAAKSVLTAVITEAAESRLEPTRTETDASFESKKENFKADAEDTIMT